MDAWWEPNPALDRLWWLLEGLTGRWPEDVSAEDVLSPGFAAVVTPPRFVRVTRDRAAVFAPVEVTGVDVEGDTATARFRDRDGERWVARVTVEGVAPRRIVHSYVRPWVPHDLTAALPRRFADGDLRRPVETSAARLVVLGGVPGSGKSAVAEGLGAAWGVPVFASDWLLGALSPFGLYHRPDLVSIGDELVTTLAARELSAGRSAVVDTTSEDAESRSRWESLAVATGAAFLAVVCVCSDPAVHRQRVERRHRGIPGWHDPGDWPDVVRRRDAFPPWPGALTVDTTASLSACVGLVLDRVSTS